MTRSAPSSDYDDDFYAWTQEQAVALRQLSREGVGDRIDIAHVAEEIEDLGQRDLRDVVSLLVRLCQHLIKIDYATASLDVPHWQAEVLTLRFSAARAFSHSMRQNLDIAQIWRQSRSVAARSCATTDASLTAPIACPFTLDDLLSDDFDLDDALAKLAAARLAAADLRDTPLP